MHRALIRTCQVPRPLVSSIKKSSTTSHRLVAFRTQSSQSERVETNVVVESSDSETLAVQSIEDAIHRIIERRSAPDWLPFVPGSSYWVPPRKPSYGIADLVEKLANSLTDDEVMSLATTRGWPSSSFFVNDTSPDPAEVESTSTCTSQSVDEEG
ncbi:hypothetical protein Vadar_016526 [Vaccinium darrowii]|uniref:Uncharacterized protein n=1 Tax=Vaccinium darrowii TaxID=229202 RepID=A0ACB7YW10_9ERIC|nr:hypothetical protein Vadar_016526 [Vaccinium darrowii]